MLLTYRPSSENHQESGDKLRHLMVWGFGVSGASILRGFSFCEPMVEAHCYEFKTKHQTNYGNWRVPINMGATSFSMMNNNHEEV